MKSERPSLVETIRTKSKILVHRIGDSIFTTSTIRVCACACVCVCVFVCVRCALVSVCACVRVRGGKRRVCVCVYVYACMRERVCQSNHDENTVPVSKGMPVNVHYVYRGEHAAGPADAFCHSPARAACLHHMLYFSSAAAWRISRFSIVVHIDQSLVYMPRSDDHQTITVIVCIWKICGTDATPLQGL